MCLDTKKRTNDYEPKGSGNSANLTCRLYKTDCTEVSNELPVKKTRNMTSHSADALFPHANLLASRSKDVNLEVTTT